MKRVAIIILLAGIMGSMLNAQSAVDKVFNKYAGQEGYTTVKVNAFMFKFLSSIETDDPDYENFKKATSGLESIRILTQDGPGSAPFGKELLDILPREDYQELMVVKEADEDVVFLVKEEKGKITEFLLVVSSKTEDDALIVFTGNIDMEAISSIASGMDLPAVENLEELNNQ